MALRVLLTAFAAAAFLMPFTLKEQKGVGVIFLLGTKKGVGVIYSRLNKKGSVSFFSQRRCAICCPVKKNDTDPFLFFCSFLFFAVEVTA